MIDYFFTQNVKKALNEKTVCVYRDVINSQRGQQMTITHRPTEPPSDRNNEKTMDDTREPGILAATFVHLSVAQIIGAMQSAANEMQARVNSAAAARHLDAITDECNDLATLIDHIPSSLERKEKHDADPVEVAS